VAGQAAQIASKGVGEAFGLGSGEMKLKPSETHTSTSNVTALSVEPKRTATEDLVALSAADDVGVDGSFGKIYLTETTKLTPSERKAVARTVTETFKRLNPEPLQDVKETADDFTKRQGEYKSRQLVVARVTLGFAQNGYRDTEMIARLLNDQGWSRETLQGLDKVLSRSRREFKEKVRQGLPEAQAREQAVLDALAELGKGKKFKDLAKSERQEVTESCRCAGACPLPKAAAVEKPKFQVCAWP